MHSGMASGEVERVGFLQVWTAQSKTARLGFHWAGTLSEQLAVCERNKIKIWEAEKRARKGAIATHSEALETGLQEKPGSGFNLNGKWERPGTVNTENALCFISQLFRETEFYNSLYIKGIAAKISILSSDYNLTETMHWTLTFG